MRTLSQFFFVAFIMAIFLGSSVPAFATNAAANDGHIKVEVNGSDGITIKPGNYPDLGTTTDDIQKAAAETVVNKSKLVSQTITAVCTLICFVALLINIVKLSTSNGMAIMRRQALIGLLWSGVSLALFGGAWVVVSFFWNFLS